MAWTLIADGDRYEDGTGWLKEFRILTERKGSRVVTKLQARIAYTDESGNPHWGVTDYKKLDGELKDVIEFWKNRFARSAGIPSPVWQQWINGVKQ